MLIVSMLVPWFDRDLNCTTRFNGGVDDNDDDNGNMSIESAAAAKCCRKHISFVVSVRIPSVACSHLLEPRNHWLFVVVLVVYEYDIIVNISLCFLLISRI